MTAKCRKHPTLRRTYCVDAGGQVIGTVEQTSPRSPWSAHLAGGRLVASGYRTRGEAVDAVVRNAGTPAWLPLKVGLESDEDQVLPLSAD